MLNNLQRLLNQNASHIDPWEGVGKLQIFWRSQTSYRFMSDSFVEKDVKMTEKTQSIKATALHVKAQIILAEMSWRNLKLSRKMKHCLHVV